MKRDMEVVRKTLIGMEDSDEGLFMLSQIARLSGRERQDEAVEYVMMLHSAGFIDSPQQSVYRMSWAGYEFLDTIRDPEIWRKTKAGAGKVGSWSVKLLAEIATGYARAKAVELGLPIAG